MGFIKNLFVKSGVKENTVPGVGVLQNDTLNQQYSSGFTNFDATRNNKPLFAKYYKNLPYSIINVIASNIQKCIPVVFNWQNNEPIWEHEFYNLIYGKNKPNPDYSFQQLMWGTTTDIYIYGDGFIYTPLTNFGEPGELWRLFSINTSIRTAGGQIKSYAYYNPKVIGTKPIEYDKELIMHFNFPSEDASVYGRGLIQSGLEIFEKEAEINNYQVRSFKNDAATNFALCTDKHLNQNQIDIIVEKLNKKHAGSDNAKKPMILPDGLKPVNFGANPKESDFLESQKQVIKEILSLAHIHPALVGLMEDVNKSNMVEAYLHFKEFTLDPILEMMNGVFSKYVQNYYDESLVIQFQPPVVFKQAEEIQRLELGAKYGLITYREGRDKLGFDALTGQNAAKNDLLISANNNSSDNTGQQTNSLSKEMIEKIKSIKSEKEKLFEKNLNKLRMRGCYTDNKRFY